MYLGVVCDRMSAVVRSGLVAAKKIAVGPGVAFSQDGGSLGADLVHDLGHLVGLRLPQGQRTGQHRVGGARAAPVKVDHSAE
jgi:hypothetical protein